VNIKSWKITSQEKLKWRRKPRRKFCFSDDGFLSVTFKKKIYHSFHLSMFLECFSFTNCKFNLKYENKNGWWCILMVYQRTRKITFKNNYIESFFNTNYQKLIICTLGLHKAHARFHSFLFLSLHFWFYFSSHIWGTDTSFEFANLCDIPSIQSILVARAISWKKLWSKDEKSTKQKIKQQTWYTLSLPKYV
jgi:hypothetical protein